MANVPQSHLDREQDHIVKGHERKLTLQICRRAVLVFQVAYREAN